MGCTMLLKRVALLLLLFCVTSPSFAQSKSFKTLQGHFQGKEEVHAFNVNGLFVRLALLMVDESDFNKEAIKKIKSLHLITVPKAHFRSKDLTVNGFIRYIASDSFEELASVKDNGEHVGLYMQSNHKKYNRYIVLIEDHTDVTAIEVQGYIDPNLIFATSAHTCE